MSPSRNWDSPTPSLASECGPPPAGTGGGHSRAGEGLGESLFQRLEKKLSLLPTMWAHTLDCLPFHTVYRRIKKSAACTVCGQVIERENMNAYWTQHKKETTVHQKIHKREGKRRAETGGLAIPSQVMSYTVCAHSNNILPKICYKNHWMVTVFLPE